MLSQSGASRFFAIALWLDQCHRPGRFAKPARTGAQAKSRDTAESHSSFSMLMAL
jgi:hypothetical protein